MGCRAPTARTGCIWGQQRPHRLMRSARLKLIVENCHADLPYEEVRQQPAAPGPTIGAGSGNDVAIAVQGRPARRRGRDRPRIHQIGEAATPDGPTRTRASPYVNDGPGRFSSSRAPRTTGSCSPLPDSWVLVGGGLLVRLGSYLFTKGADASARDHLAPGGAFAMYNYYREDRLIERLGGTGALDAIGHAPCVDRVGTGDKRASGDLGRPQAACDQSCRKGQVEAVAAAREAPATDDQAVRLFHRLRRFRSSTCVARRDPCC